MPRCFPFHRRCLQSFTLFFTLSPFTHALPKTDHTLDIEHSLAQPLQSNTVVDGNRRSFLRRQNDQLQATVVNQPSVEQPQNITSDAGSNGTSTLPGVIANDNTSLSQIDCRNLDTGRDNKCWEELQLTNWVNRWIATHQCYQGEEFATCFLRQEGFWGLDCTGIKPESCGTPQSDRVGVQPEVFYVAYNIYSVNQFFYSWYTAVGDAGQTAGLNVDQIVQILQVPDNTNLIMDNILITLTGIFALAPVGLTSIRSTLTLGAGVAASMQTFENALFAYPQIGRFLFPIGGPEANLVAIASLKTELVGVLQQVQSNLNKTCVSVMSNVTEFLAFASQGNFTTSPPSLPDQSNYLLYGFNTYLVSAALAQNDVHAVLALDTNPQQLATNGTKLAYDIGCESYSEAGVCGQWWWDGEQNIAYGLDDFRHMNRDMNEVLNIILSNYTTGELLFRNAYTCNVGGGFGAPVNVTVNAAGVNTACLSQLRTLRWDMRCREAKIGTPCEFLDEKSQNTWMESCGSHSFYSVMDENVYCVPKSYLGPLISQTKTKLQTS